MSHRIDLKMLGFKSVKYGSEQEIKKLAKELDDKDISKKVIKVNDNAWELYAKKLKK